MAAEIDHCYLSVDPITIRNSVGGPASDLERVEDESSKIEQDYLSRMEGLLLKWVTPKSLEMANTVMKYTKLYQRLLDEAERHFRLASTDETGCLSL